MVSGDSLHSQLSQRKKRHGGAGKQSQEIIQGGGAGIICKLVPPQPTETHPDYFTNPLGSSQANQLDTTSLTTTLMCFKITGTKMSWVTPACSPTTSCTIGGTLGR